MRQPQTSSSHRAAAAEKLYTFSPEEMVALADHVRHEHCAGLLLTLFLRMLRWQEATVAFRHFLDRMNGNFAPSTIPFVERRFTQGHAAMVELAAALEGRAASAVNVALFRVIHIVTRLAAVVHTEVLLQLCKPPFLDLICRVEGLEAVVDGVIALLAACWSWRKAAAQGWPGRTSFPRPLPANLPGRRRTAIRGTSDLIASLLWWQAGQQPLQPWPQESQPPLQPQQPPCPTTPRADGPRAGALCSASGTLLAVGTVLRMGHERGRVERFDEAGGW